MSNMNVGHGRESLLKLESVNQARIGLVRSDELSDAAAHHSTLNWNGAASGSGSIELQRGLAKAGAQGQRFRNFSCN